MSTIQRKTHPNLNEKLHKFGASSLSNAELLATLLGRASPTQPAIEIAQTLLSRFGSLQALFQASQPRLCQQPGITLAKYAQIQAAQELSRRALFEPLQHQAITSTSTNLLNYLNAELRCQAQEIFACLFLDSRYRLIRFEKLFMGTLDMTAIHPRIIAKRALDYNAFALIAAHNHPSGNLTPSLEDQRVTLHIDQVLDLFDIKLLDHILIAGNQSLSFREHGLL